ncbi:MAG: hypothetical protein PHT07_10480 [Paludibacter sp.]|nr:hypothetical protein [Paludibacter sp.]
MSSAKKNTGKIILLIGLLIAIGVIVYTNYFATTSSPVTATPSVSAEAARPSAPLDIANHVPPPTIDSNSAETVTMSGPASSSVTIMSPSITSSGGVLDDKGLDNVFLTFSAQKNKAEANSKDAKKTPDSSSVSMAPPRFTSERKILPVTGASIGSGEQMVMFGPGSANQGMTPPPAPEPVKTKVVFCADGDCGELTTQGYRKIAPLPKAQKK